MSTTTHAVASRRNSARCGRLAVVLCVVSARSAGAQSAAETSSTCPVEQREALKLRPGENSAVYIEPHAFARAGRSWVLAGEPMYRWKRDSSGAAQLDSSASLFGVGFDGRYLTLIPKPPVPGVVTHARLAVSEEGLVALFAETDASSIGRRQARLLGYWHARNDGNEWHALERVPVPQGGELNVERASRLLRTSESLLIAIPFGSNRNDRVVVFRRSTSGWLTQIVPVGDVSYVTAAVVAGRPHLYVVRPDSTRLPDSNSLSLFSLADTSWKDQGFIVRGGMRPIHHPAISEGAGTLVLSWREDDASTRQLNARAAIVRENGTLRPSVVLRRGISDLIPLRSANDAFRWVVARPDATGRATLELIEWNGDEPLVRDVVIDPFTGPSLAFASEEGDAIAGPVMSLLPGDEVVATAIVRFVNRCRVPVDKAP